MSTTMTPFLYQTRTLSNPNWTRASSIYRPRYRRIIQRNFSCATRAQYSIDHRNVPLTTPKPADSEGFTIRRTINVHGAEPGAAGRWELDPNGRSEGQGIFEDQESGVPIRRISGQENHNPGKSAATPRRIGKATNKRNYDTGDADDMDFVQSEAIDFDEEFEQDILAGKDEIADLTRSYEGRESTITDSERYAFQKIFSDIFGRNQRTGVSLKDDFSEEPEYSSTKPVDMERAKSKLDNILSNAMQRQPQTRQEMEHMVNRYPPALRAAAAKAIGLTEAEAEAEENGSHEGKALDTEQLETLREPERTRVEGLMKAANTDFQLWEVMQKEVFSLISKLGLEDSSKSAEEAHIEVTKKRKSSRKPKKAEAAQALDQPVTEVQSTSDSATISEDGISPLAIYGPLYPSYLLLGLRLLDRSFAKPSPLALSLLPKIKSLGLISHVLGASTQLYNELLRIHRYRHDDYRSILNLLSEMENSGLELDQETLDIVMDIQRTQLSVRRGEKGPAIQALWGLPEFAPNKFKIWREKIGVAINGRAQNQGTRLRY